MNIETIGNVKCTETGYTIGNPGRNLGMNGFAYVRLPLLGSWDIRELGLVTSHLDIVSRCHTEGQYHRESHGWAVSQGVTQVECHRM